METELCTMKYAVKMPLCKVVGILEVGRMQSSLELQSNIISWYLRIECLPSTKGSQ